MKRLGLVAVAILSVLLQVSFLPALRLFGVVPNLVLVIVVLVGLEGTSSSALVIAVIAGVICDMSSGTNFGLWTGLLVLAALVTGLIHRAGFELSGPIVAMSMVCAGTLLETGVILLGLVNSVSSWPIGFLLGHFCVEIMLNLVLTIALRPLIRSVVPGVDPGVTVIG
jgi:rod shape-determining protein MreD